MSKTLSSSVCKLIEHKVLSSLVNEDDTKQYYKEMFEAEEWAPAERTLIT